MFSTIDFAGYFESLFATGGLAYVALGLFVFFALSVLWGALRGGSRGASRQILHIIFTAGAGVIAFFLCTWLTGQLAVHTDGKTVGDVIRELQASGILTEIAESDVIGLDSYDGETLKYLLALPLATVAVPVLFIVLFFVIDLVIKLIYLLVCAIAGLHRHGGFLKKAGGFLIGACEGVIFAALILVPVFSVSRTVTTAADQLREEEAAADFVAISDECFSFISDSPLAEIMMSCGGDMLMEKLSTVDLRGESLDLRGELVNGIRMGVISTKLSGTNWSELSDADKAVLDQLLAELDSSEYMRTLFAGILRGTATAVEDGFIPFKAEPPYDRMVVELLHIFETSTAGNITADLTTVKDIVYLLSDDGVLVAISTGDSSVLTNALTAVDGNGETTVKRAITIMKANPRTASLVSTLTEFSVAMLSSSLGLGDDAGEVYESVKSGVVDVLSIDRNQYETSDEYVAAVSGELDAKLKENDIELEPEIIDEMAQNIYENELDLGEITEETVDDVILSYYDAYLKGQLELPSEPSDEPEV